MIEICKALDGKMCSCGKVHEFPVKKILCSSGASEKLGEQARALGATCAFVICDKTTWGVLAEKAVRILNESGIPSVVARLSCEVSEPDESSLGSLMMRYDPSCDVIV